MKNLFTQKEYNTEVGRILSSENILFEEFLLSRPVHTVADVAVECNCTFEQVVKTLLFIGEKNSFLIVSSGDKRINVESLSSTANQKMKMATPKQVIEITSYSVGAVSPFLKNYPDSLVLYADKSLLNNDKLYLGSGDSMILVSMLSSEFEKAFKGTFLKI